MTRQFRHGIPLLAATAAILGFPSCADERPWGNDSEERGSIQLTLSADYGISTSKPVFRSEGTSTGDLADYIELPNVEDFNISLKNPNGTTDTWTSLQAFIDEAKDKGFAPGSYTLTAYYGEKGSQGFEKHYFEATETFKVLADQTHDLNLVAELKNSLVAVSYTDAFKDYMSDYHASLTTEGLAEDIKFTSTENRAAFIEPNNAGLSLHFTTKGGKSTVVDLGKFAPQAKTLHRVTLDLVENNNGTASLEVNFDDTLDDEDVHIDLTDELFSTAAPVITCDGFANGDVIDMLEGTGSDLSLKMNVFAAGKIKSAVMTVESDTYRAPWGNEIDLCSATEAQKEQIGKAGIEALGFGFTAPADQQAYLLLTDFGKSLPTGTHTISLKVTDKSDRTSDLVKVTLDSKPVEISVLGAPAMTYGADNADIKVAYNGSNPADYISFQANDATGMPIALTVNRCSEDASTRGFELKNYVFNVAIPESMRARKEFDFEVYYKEESKGKAEGTISVEVPAYSLSYDAFSHYAYVKVNAEATALAAITQNISLKLNGTAASGIDRDLENGLLILKNLEAGQEYKVSSTITNGDTREEQPSFTTEAALAIPNGDFSKTAQTINMDVQCGGTWTGTAFSNPKYHESTTIQIQEPSNWSSINAYTCYDGSSNKNSWYCVPSTYVENGATIIRNVGFSHNGRELKNTNKTAVYYSEDHPSENELTKAAGELFLGSFTCFGDTYNKEEGHPFASRPSQISFQYKYTLKDNKADKGIAVIKMRSVDGNTVADKEILLDPTETVKTISIPLEYGTFTDRVSKLTISFKSSNQDIPIVIPTGSQLKSGSGVGTHDRTIDYFEAKAVATGSELWVDNVKAVYDNAPKAAAKAAKRTNSKR